MTPVQRAVGRPHRPCWELLLEALSCLCGLEPLIPKWGRCELFVSQARIKQLRGRGPLDTCDRRCPCCWVISPSGKKLADQPRSAFTQQPLRPLVTHSGPVLDPSYALVWDLHVKCEKCPRVEGMNVPPKRTGRREPNWPHLFFRSPPSPRPAW